MATQKFAYGVRKIEGLYHVEIEPGRLMPIRNEGGAVIGPPGTYLPGWEPQFVYAGFAPVYLLEWKHEDGNEGGWYLNTEMTSVGDSHAGLPPFYSSTVRQKASAIFAKVWDQLLCATNPEVDEATRAFFSIDCGTLSAILALCGPFDLQLIELDLMRGNDRPLQVFNGSRIIDVRSALLLKTLEEKPTILEKAIAGLPAGVLSWSSPVDGRPLTTDTGLCFDDFRYAYRLVDPAHDLLFYAVAADHRATSVALFFPTSRQIFCNKEHWVWDLLPPLGELFMLHLCNYGALLEGYLTAPSRRLTTFFRERHHGHLLWNELSGIDKLVHAVPKTALPDVLIMAPTKAVGSVEVYGELQILFPEFLGKVDRSITDTNALIRHAYSERRCIVRPTDDFVNRRLAERIVAVNLAGPGLEGEWAQLERIVAKGWPLVLLDLRVENRTIVDITGFYTRLIAFILAETGGAAIALCGHTGEYVAPHALGAKRSPLEVHSEITAELVRTLEQPNLELINASGTGMRRTIFWCYHAHFTVGSWGAGLATYRWVCNKPGLVLAGPWNLRNNPDLPIYHAPEFMEDPSELRFLAEEHVKDAPDASILQEIPGHPTESWTNFLVNEEAAFAEVRKLLKKYGPRPRI